MIPSAGSAPVAREKATAENTAVVNKTIFIVDDRTVGLLQDLPTREVIEDLGKKAGRVAGLERLRIGSDAPDHEAIRRERDDLPSLRVPPEPDEPDEPDIEVTHRDVWLKIVSVHFRDGYKWRFSDGGERPFTAEMEDTEFQNKVQEGDIALNASNAIRCRLREEQSLSASNLLQSVFVEEVPEHRPRARQLNLL